MCSSDLCAFVQPWAAAVIGILAAVLIIESVFFFERKGIDDPVGAISVHGIGGLFGVLCVGIFSSGDYGAGWNLTTKGAAAKASGVTGILYDLDLGSKQLASQAIGVVVICTVIFGIAFAFFKIQNALTKGGIRSEAEHEEIGLDMPEMGGLEATRLLKHEMPALPIVVLTASESEDDLFDAVKSGAQGYLLKNLEPAELIAHVQAAARGEPALTPALASKLLSEFARLSRPISRQATGISRARCCVCNCASRQVSHANTAERE